MELTHPAAARSEICNHCHAGYRCAGTDVRRPCVEGTGLLCACYLDSLMWQHPK